MGYLSNLCSACNCQRQRNESRERWTFSPLKIERSGRAFLRLGTYILSNRSRSLELGGSINVWVVSLVLYYQGGVLVFSQNGRILGGSTPAEILSGLRASSAFEVGSRASGPLSFFLCNTWGL